MPVEFLGPALMGVWRVLPDGTL